MTVGDWQTGDFTYFGKIANLQQPPASLALGTPLKGGRASCLCTSEAQGKGLVPTRTVSTSNFYEQRKHP